MKRFYRAVGMLSAGTFVGQLLLVGAAPILTRLYGAEEFGLFAALTGVALLMGHVASLRYELVLPIAPDENEAANLLALCLVLGTSSGVIVFALTCFGGSVIEQSFGAHTWIMWASLTPTIVVFCSMGTILEYWSLRKRSIGTNAWMRVVFVGVQVAVQVGCGLLGISKWGLGLGLASGHLFRVIGFARYTDAWSTLRAKTPPPTSVLACARKYWRYPAFAAPANLIHESNLLVPVSLVAIVYDMETAGFFGLAQRIMEAPVRLLSQSTSLLFLREAAALKSPEVVVLFRKIVVRFTFVALGGLLPILSFGPQLFAILFGEPWREAGVFAQLLVPFQLMRFVAGAVANALTLHQRNDLLCLTAGLGALALAASFASGWLFELSAHVTIAMFASATAGTYALQLFLSERVLRAAVAGQEPPPPAPSQRAEGPTA